MKRILLFATLAIILAIAALGGHAWFTDRGRDATAPVFSGLAGTFVGGTLQYPADPAAVFRFAPGFDYVGGQKFILYGTTDSAS